MKITDPFGFYGIMTDPACGYERLAEIFVAHEVRFIQLRMKKAPANGMTRIAESIRKITQGTRSLLIINDDPGIARAVDADGVHLGQEDLDFQEARRILGTEKIIGLSTHNPDQTRAACEKGPSYIGVGPVFRTPTKEKPDPVIGVQGMKAMLSLSTVPAVAIGGINETNLHEVLRAGARNFCSVRPLNGSKEPEKALKNLLKIYHEFV